MVVVEVGCVGVGLCLIILVLSQRLVFCGGGGGVGGAADFVKLL